MAADYLSRVWKEQDQNKIAASLNVVENTSSNATIALDIVFANYKRNFGLSNISKEEKLTTEAEITRYSLTYRTINNTEVLVDKKKEFIFLLYYNKKQ